VRGWIAAAALTYGATLVAQASSAPDLVTTHHTIRVRGRTIGYTARAGRLAIRANETGEVHGWVFFVAYTADQPAGAAPRPLTFLWNGGPGANSELVHLIGFGPRRLVAPDSAKPTTLAVRDNEFTWLDATDLVFVDPVGTGYARAAKPEFAKEFYGTLGDIAAITEFVRVYLTRFEAWQRPLFVGGESFGVWRAAGVAEALEKRGIPVAGEILISGGIPVLATTPYEMKAALFLPTRTAAALYHKKLAPALEADPQAGWTNAAKWAREVYGPALQRFDSLGPTERASIRNGLAIFSGLDTALIDPRTLVIRRSDFGRQLLADQKLVLGRFDTRIARPAGEYVSTALDEARDALTVRYLRTELGYRTDLAYLGAEAGYDPVVVPRALSAGEAWDYDQNAPPPLDSAAAKAAAAAYAARAARRLVDDGPPNGAEPWLRRAMLIDPKLRAFVAVGLYDSLNSCAWNDWLITTLDAPLRANITANCYVGGHMMYEDADARRRLKDDVAAFIRARTAPPPAR
jgi:carboxypeptidase C (cathepsin A)